MVLRATPVLVSVVLDADHPIGPTHVDPPSYPAPLVGNRNLRGRAGQSTADEHQAKPRLLRGFGSRVGEVECLAQSPDTAGARITLRDIHDAVDADVCDVQQGIDADDRRVEGLASADVVASAGDAGAGHLADELKLVVGDDAGVDQDPGRRGLAGAGQFGRRVVGEPFATQHCRGGIPGKRGVAARPQPRGHRPVVCGQQQTCWRIDILVHHDICLDRNVWRVADPAAIASLPTMICPTDIRRGVRTAGSRARRDYGL